MRDKRLIYEKLLMAISIFSAIIVCGVTLFIIGLVILKGASSLTFEFLTSSPGANMSSGGILPVILGTVELVFMMTVITVPLGALIAIYLNEISARNWLYNVIISSVRALAAVPSIVYGLFGLAFFVTIMGGGLDWLMGYDHPVFRQRCLLWAAVTMGALTMPTNVVAVIEALELVPDEQRRAGICLGYTRWEIIKWIVAPQAISGALTGLVLSISRGAGEVAPILFVGVAFFMPDFDGNPLGQFMDLGYHIFVLATQSSNVEKTLPAQYGSTLVLLAMIYAFNSVGQVIRWRQRKKMNI